MKKWLALILTALIVLIIDQGAKAWILATIPFHESIAPIPALSEVFRFTLSANRGAAFSILPQLGDIFLILAIVMSVGVIVGYRYIPAGYWPERIALGLVLGGGLGNALDRLRFGYVVDFFHVIIPPLRISNVSNFADHAIVIGVFVLIGMSWFIRKSPAPESKAEVKPDNPSISE